jgi:hypothetical protein
MDAAGYLLATSRVIIRQWQIIIVGGEGRQNQKKEMDEEYLESTRFQFCFCLNTHLQIHKI